MKKTATILGIIVVSLTIVTKLWGYVADWEELKHKVELKADKTEVQSLHNRLDKVMLGLCIINKKTCVLSKEKR